MGFETNSKRRERSDSGVWEKAPGKLSIVRKESLAAHHNKNPPAMRVDFYYALFFLNSDGVCPVRFLNSLLKW